MAKRGPPILITTTALIEGRQISEYLGLVASQAIVGANVVADIFASVRDILGGRSKSYERVLRRAREDALLGLEDEAYAIDADAVIGVDLDYSTVGPNGGLMMVSVTGTAVRFARPPKR